MSEPSNGAWPFQEIPEEEGLDISAIFGDSSAAPQGDPFAPPAAAQSVPSSPTPVAQEITPAVAATSQPTTAPIAKAPVEAPAENPIAAAFEQKTAENTKKGLLEKPPVCGSEHQGTGRYERQQHACYAPSAGRQADPGLRPRRTARTEHRHRSEQCKAHHASAGYRGILRAGILRDRPARGQGGINSDSAKNGKEQFFEKDRAVSNYQPDAFGLQVL